MDGTTQFLGQMISPYLVVTGVGFFVSKDYYLKMLADSKRLESITINLSGMVHFLLGLAIVLNHNLWRTSPEIIITVIGFAATLKGAALIVIPQTALKANDMSARVLRTIGTAFRGRRGVPWFCDVLRISLTAALPTSTAT